MTGGDGTFSGGWCWQEMTFLPTSVLEQYYVSMSGLVALPVNPK
ncbi:MAG: hypothetical protein ACM3U2_02210 [Deltaproteobacteria bacterium]